MLVGLTGQMGAGKTTLACHLRCRGARIVDADQLGHEMLERPLVKSGLEQAFGAQVLGEDGSIDRGALANLAFKDADGVSSLNKIVGEPLNAELWRRVEHARGTPDEIVIVDAALLVEWGMQSRFDTIIVVTVDEVESVIGRLESNRGLDRDEIRRRLKAQGSVEDKLAVADFVVHNDGNLEAFEERADALWLDLEQLRLRMSAGFTNPTPN